MFRVELFSTFNGWTPLANPEGGTDYTTKPEAITAAQLYRIESHGKGRKPCRVTETVVHKEWASDAPTEI